MRLAYVIVVERPTSDWRRLFTLLHHPDDVFLFLFTGGAASRHVEEYKTLTASYANVAAVRPGSAASLETPVGRLRAVDAAIQTALTFSADWTHLVQLNDAHLPLKPRGDVAGRLALEPTGRRLWEGPTGFVLTRSAAEQAVKLQDVIYRVTKESVPTLAAAAHCLVRDAETSVDDGFFLTAPNKIWTAADLPTLYDSSALYAHPFDAAADSRVVETLFEMLDPSKRFRRPVFRTPSV
ncbi:MAG: hypothetical protein ACRC1K_13560 [Planctomycetia bacterium]